MHTDPSMNFVCKITLESQQLVFQINFTSHLRECSRVIVYSRLLYMSALSFQQVAAKQDVGRKKLILIYPAKVVLYGYRSVEYFRHRRVVGLLCSVLS